MKAHVCKLMVSLMVLGATTGAPALEEERLSTFAWFGRLGFPDIKERPFVRVATGYSERGENEPPRMHYVYGFLLEDSGPTFEVLLPTLEIRTYEKTGAEVGAGKRIGYDAIDLARWAASELKSLNERAQGGERDRWRRLGAQLTERGEVFVMSWACWRYGIDGTSRELYDRAAKMAVGQRRRQDEPTQSFQQRLAADLAHADAWRLIEDFGDAKISRTKLAVRCRRHLGNYPESEYHERIKEAADLLWQMVQEDTDHAERRKQGKPFEQLTKAEQIAELIFQLRDQNGHQFSQPGSCDIFFDLASMLDDKKPRSPAHQLLEFGYDAVPQLIEALENQRFTRSVECHRDFYFSHHVLRIGDAAEQILARIAGQTFYEPKSTSGAMSKDDQTKAVKVAVQAWYANLQQKGEKQLLIEATQRGDWNSREQAKRLVAKYPDAALHAIAAGLRLATDNQVRMALLEAVHKLKGEDSDKLLVEQVRDAATFPTRLCAAQILQVRGRMEGVAAMINEWQKDPPPLLARRSRPDDLVDEGPAGGLPYVADFLAASGSSDGIAALGRNWNQRPERLRTAAIAAFGDRNSLRSLLWFHDSTLEPRAVELRKQSPEARAAIERLMIMALDDPEEAEHGPRDWNNKELNDPRICDLAGQALNDLDPARYAFDAAAPLPERNRALAQLKNVVRIAKGMAALPVPEIAKVPPAPQEQLSPLLDQLLRSSVADRPAHQRAIEGLGLGALPGVHKRLESKGLTDTERAVLAEEVWRLATIVTEVVTAPKSAKPEETLLAKLDGMKGRSFEPETFLKVIQSLLTDTPRGVRGFRFAAVRMGDGRGFAIKVDLLDERRAAEVELSSWIRPPDNPPKDRAYWWHSEQSVQVGRECLLSSSGGFSASATDDDARLLEHLGKACEAKVTERIRIDFQFIGEWAK